MGIRQKPMKKCNRCKTPKDDNQFVEGKSKCLDCIQKLKEYYQKNRNRIIKNAKKYYPKTPEKILHKQEQKRKWIRKNPVSYLLCAAKARAKKRGILFNLSHEDIVIPEKCPVLGIKLKISDKTISCNSPSVDRINPKMGYVKGNVAVISYRANSIKNDATSKELEMVLEYVKKMECREA
jgi:hypothetical protein